MKRQTIINVILTIVAILAFIFVVYQAVNFNIIPTRISTPASANNTAGQSAKLK